ncbi:MAG: FecR domain-containing protein [Prolixibacteraceae bacterium]
MKQSDHIDTILPAYFCGKLSPEQKQIIEAWKNASEENGLIFKKAESVWKGLDLLREMRTYDTGRALLKVHAAILREQALPDPNVSGNAQIEPDHNQTLPYTAGQARLSIRARQGQTMEYPADREPHLSKTGQPEKSGDFQTIRHKGFLFYWQRIAAILLLPVIFFGIAYYFINDKTDSGTAAWQTISTPPGVKSQTQLPDGTKVWLNSDTRLSYPVTFAHNRRQVKLEGEAFFEVVKNSRQPFCVDLGKIGIEVTGTAFNAINYIGEKQTEVILTSGKINLLDQHGNKRRLVTEMTPGEKAIFRESSGKIAIQRVDTDKYTSWIHGRLVFRDDAMAEVIRRLNRWFNVEIEIPDSEIAQYVYTATFSDETIEQILDLFKRTSPVQYTVIPAPRNDDGSFGKQRIILKPR